MSRFTREQYRQADKVALCAEAIGVLIGRALSGGFYALGVCAILKLFGVI